MMGGKPVKNHKPNSSQCNHYGYTFNPKQDRIKTINPAIMPICNLKLQGYGLVPVPCIL